MRICVFVACLVARGGLAADGNISTGVVFFEDDVRLQSFEKQAGSIVRYVAPGSPAALAGLQKYDVLVSINDRADLSPQMRAKARDAFVRGACLKMVVVRKGQRMQLPELCRNKARDLDRDEVLDDASRLAPVVEIHPIKGLTGDAATFEIGTQSLANVVAGYLAGREFVRLCIVATGPRTATGPWTCTQLVAELEKLPATRSYIVTLEPLEANKPEK